MKDIFEEIIKSGTVKQVVDFFTPKISAGIIQALAKIYEETYDNDTNNQQFVIFSFEKIVLSHPGWLSYMQTPGDKIMKDMGYTGVSLRLYHAGLDYLREQNKAE